MGHVERGRYEKCIHSFVRKGRCHLGDPDVDGRKRFMTAWTGLFWLRNMTGGCEHVNELLVWMCGRILDRLS
jgi:hypothetical protein